MKLTYQNDWEYDMYFIDGKPVKSLTAVEIDGKVYKVKKRNVSVTYYDMGHHYTANSPHFFVNSSMLGLPYEVDLNTIVPKKPVIPVIYKLF